MAVCGLVPDGDVAEPWLIAFRVLQGVGGGLLIPSATVLVLNAFYRELLQSGRRTGKAKGTGLAPITVSKIHAVLHGALSWGVKLGDLSRNVAAIADRPSSPVRISTRLT